MAEARKLEQGRERGAAVKVLLAVRNPWGALLVLLAALAAGHQAILLMTHVGPSPASQESWESFGRDLAALHAQVVASQRRRRFVFEALRHGRPTPWDFQPPSDASRRYVRSHMTLGEIEAGARFPRPLGRKPPPQPSPGSAGGGGTIPSLTKGGGG